MRKAVLLTVVLAASLVQAEQATNLPRIGYLARSLHPSDSRVTTALNVQAFRQGLKDLGYVEGKNLIIEYRYADERLERLAALAEELVRLKVDVIVADTTSTARAVKKVTSTVPIVFLSGSDPTQSGLAASLARPGGNVTGLTNLAGELRGKRLELLKEVLPKVNRFALLEGTGGVARETNIPAAQKLAAGQGLTLQLIEVNSANPDLDGAFRKILKENIGGLVVGTGTILDLTLQRKKILALALQNRMPSIYAIVAYAEEGGLMYYGANTPDLSRHGATIVDKVLKGARPGDLPIERASKFDFVINLKTAKQIGLTIPQTVLARADKVIR